MKYFSLIILFLVISCGKKEDILLPKSNVTIVGNVEDHSPIYIFFRIKEKDTLAEVNKKNEIISTNWIFNIDKRLPLRMVIPEVMNYRTKSEMKKPKTIIRMRIVFIKVWLLFPLQMCIINWKSQCLVLLCFFLKKMKFL